MLVKIISYFILFTSTGHLFTRIDSTRFKLTHASESIEAEQNYEGRNILNCQLVQMYYNK
jgi:hypothetical protein